MAMAVLYDGRIEPERAVRRIASSSAIAALGFFLAAALEALFSGGVLAGFSLRTGVGTLMAFVIVLSTHRGLARTLERGFALLPTPGFVHRPV
jgi:preprotein translocase subunit SecD